MVIRKILTGGLLLCSLGLTQPVMAQDNPSRQTIEVSARGGLPNFTAKLKSGKSVKIGYLGGSITAQPGWRVLSREWFQNKYPKAKISEINAAIGGTGSNLGVFRVEHDVLCQKPDLLFVEFAVNDGRTLPANIRKSMEGIVRKTWKALPDCDICFVYTMTAGNLKEMQKGKMSRSASTMEEVADYYNIPTIHMGLEIAALEKAGKLVMKAPNANLQQVSGKELNEEAKIQTDEKGRITFSKDGVHPYPNTGHVLYLKAIIRSMDKILPAGKPGPHKLAASKTKDNWEKAEMIPVNKCKMSGPWKKLDPKSNSLAKNFRNRVPSLWQGKPGAELKFKFIGTKVAAYDLVGPSCGYVEATIDGKKIKSRRMDKYCSYYRSSIMKIADGLENKVHEVVIRVLPDKFDKSKILAKHRLKDLEKNPKKYEDTDWYVGAVFIIGKMVD